MTIFHFDIQSGEPMRHDDSYAKGFIVNIEIFRLTLNFWAGL